VIPAMAHLKLLVALFFFLPVVLFRQHYMMTFEDLITRQNVPNKYGNGAMGSFFQHLKLLSFASIKLVILKSKGRNKQIIKVFKIVFSTIFFLVFSIVPFIPLTLSFQNRHQLP
jgi:hypothetical protein